MHGSVAKRDRDDRHKAAGVAGHRPQPLHEALKETGFCVMIAVADAHSSRVPPDSRCQKEKLQTCSGERGVLQRFHFGFLLALNSFSQQFRL